MLLYYLLLAPCLSYGTLLPSTCPTANIIGTLLSSTDSLPVPVLLHYFLLRPCLYIYTYGILLPSTDHCLSMWYSATFCWALPVPVVLYYLLLAPCLFLWYSTIFYWLTSNTYGSLPSFTGPLPIPIVLYYLHLALPFVTPIHMVLFYILEAGRL